MVWAYTVTISRDNSMRNKTFYDKPSMFIWIDNKLAENWAEVRIIKERGDEEYV